MSSITVKLGRTQASMMNPPNEGVVEDKRGKLWGIGRNSYGLVVLRSGSPIQAHPEFLEGKDMVQFVCWINSQLD